MPCQVACSPDNLLRVIGVDGYKVFFPPGGLNQRRIKIRSFHFQRHLSKILCFAMQVPRVV